MRCLRDALVAPAPAGLPCADRRRPARGAWPRPHRGLLNLPRYGRHQQTYAELLAVHDELIPSVKDRVTLVRLGGTLAEERTTLYRVLEWLSSSGVPARTNGVNTEADRRSRTSYAGSDDLGRPYFHSVASEDGLITENRYAGRP
ncbi:hypothetical protein ACFVYA_35915 [Amycolatopsis sp. NPDC058278]|uniref:hypothetical protein n=1 Tax=Amycolatopsis sp. NPDC058278 TaxID=3346417 RepID=UPI0036DF095C